VGCLADDGHTASEEGLAWVRGRKLGSGSFGAVYEAEAVDGRGSTQAFAVRVAQLTLRGQREEIDSDLKECSRLEHKNLVKYLGHEYTDFHLHIFLELVPGGSLAAMVRDSGALSGEPLLKALGGILEGLDYLHKHTPPVVHRDLRADNVLLGEGMTAKLADFGHRWKCGVTAMYFFGTAARAVAWTAPEVITAPNGFGCKADIWSFGCTGIEVVTAERPWGDLASDHISSFMRFISSSQATPPLPLHVPEACRDLIGRCVVRDERARPTADDLLRHAFFAAGADIGRDTRDAS